MRTENMSRNGLLIGWASEKGAVPPPGLGQIVTVEIELPAHHGFGPKCIHCQGTVIRVSSENPDAATVALRLNYMDFRAFQGHLLSAPVHGPGPAAWTA
jgi:hypothetical protein